MIEDRMLYIRPCPLFPDGLEFPSRILRRLRQGHYIVPEDAWPGDYHFWHEDNEGPRDEVKADALLRIVEFHMRVTNVVDSPTNIG